MPPPATTTCSEYWYDLRTQPQGGRWGPYRQASPTGPAPQRRSAAPSGLTPMPPPGGVPRPNAVGRQRTRHPRRPGRAALPGRLTALGHAVGRLRGRQPRAAGLRAEELPAGPRRVPPRGPGLMGVAALGPAWEVALRAAVRHAEVV